MGRKSKKYHNKNQFNGQGTTKKIKSNEWQQDKRGQKEIYITSFSNEMFKQFYQMHFMESYFGSNNQEFQQFWESLSQPLPVTFRINPTQNNYQTLQRRLENGDLVRQLVEVSNNLQAIELENIIKSVPWFPGNLAWESKLAKKELRKAVQLQQLHSYIQKCSSTGLVTRQELVSMLPPLFLDPQPGEYVLDMCAAPGSKTCQLVEAIQYASKGDPNLGGGCVIANDVDSKRAYMLTHQLSRLPTGNVIITNHGAQYFPTLIYQGARLQYDKILCDVPCTGDGAARKLPTRWLKWSGRDGCCIHPLQLSILMRALTVCKKGGLVLYSTCSLNPIEDEAVVADVFRRAQEGSFELIQINDRLQGFIGRKGLNQWPLLITDDVLYKDYTEYKQKIEEQKQKQQPLVIDEFFESLKPEDFVHEITSLNHNPQLQKILKNQNHTKQQNKFMQQIKDLRPSLFSGSNEFLDKIGIDRTMRVLPHDQDTGGFYLALFKKKDHIIWGKPNYDQKVLGQARFDEQQLQQNYQLQQNITINQHILADQQIQNEPEELEINQELLQNILDKQNQDNDIDEDDDDNIQQNLQLKNNLVLQDGLKQYKQEKKQKNEEFTQINDQDWKAITDYYGIDPLQFRQEQILGHGQNDDPILNPTKRFRYITKEVLNILKHDPQNHLKILSIGCKIFERGKESFGGQVSPFRLSQEGLAYVFPFLNKRVLQCNSDTFFHIVQNRNVKLNEIADQNLSDQLAQLGNGCFVLCVKSDDLCEQIVCQYFRGSVSLMCGQEFSQNFLIRNGKM